MDMLFDLNQIEVPIFVVDVEADGRFRMRGLNTTAERLFGLPASHIAGKTFEEACSPRMASVLNEQYRTCVERGESHQFDDFADLKDGRRWFRTTLSPCIDPKSRQVTRIMALSQNITSVMQMYERAEASALTDSLTGLPNRRGFDVAVLTACNEAASSHRTFSLCVVDLDDLKHINDQFGHRAGDEAIRRAGEILRVFVREGELAARIGGDEFFMLLRTADEGELDARLATLRSLSDRGIDVPGFVQPIRLSVGGALRRPGDNTSETLSLADAAMYHEKCSRRRTIGESL